MGRETEGRWRSDGERDRGKMTELSYLCGMLERRPPEGEN